VDYSLQEKLDLAKKIGAVAVVNASQNRARFAAIKSLTLKGGAHVSIDALGNSQGGYQAVAKCTKKGETHFRLDYCFAKRKIQLWPMNQVVS